MAEQRGNGGRGGGSIPCARGWGGPPAAGGGGVSIPWSAVLAVLPATVGAAFYFSPLTSERPASPPGGRPFGVIGDQDVDARLWQDPFMAVADQRDAKRKQEQTGDTSDFSL